RPERKHARNGWDKKETIQRERDESDAQHQSPSRELRSRRLSLRTRRKATTASEIHSRGRLDHSPAIGPAALLHLRSPRRIRIRTPLATDPLASRQMVQPWW